MPNGYTPPKLSGETQIPHELYENAKSYEFILRDVFYNYHIINFSGYKWRVKTSSSKLDPGLNYFSDSKDNVWVDKQGYLHLKLTYHNNKWYCAEVICDKSFGYGKYIFYLGSRIEQLDKNIVLGLFTFDDDPESNHRELDIEFSRWGDSTNLKNSQFVVQPFYVTGNQYRFKTQLTDADSVHYFDWKRNSILFKSVFGSDPERGVVISSYKYTGSYIPPPGNEKPRISLWLMNGLAPSNSLEAEVIIKKFGFVP